MFVRNEANNEMMFGTGINASNVNGHNGAKWTMKKSTLFRFAWNTLCMSVCLYQLYHVSDVYFKYPTVVNIEHPLRTHTEIPGITIEIWNENLWRYSILRPQYPQLFEK